MKQIILKLFLFIPPLLFLDWIIMIVVGCISNIFGANNNFFSTIYCYFGITLVVLTFSFIVYVIYKQHLQRRINV